MKTRMGLAVMIATVLAAGMSACSAQMPTPASSASMVPEPVVSSTENLQGVTVDLAVGQVLDIDTGDLAPDSYTGDVADPAVAGFVAGGEEGGATVNPGVTGLAPGTTTVTLSNADGGIQDVVFTVTVTKSARG